MQNLPVPIQPRKFSSAIEKRNAAREALSRAVGADKIAVIALHPEFVQSVLIDDVRYLSLVDLMDIFGEENREAKSRRDDFNPRAYWNARKKALLAKDLELSNSVGQLKLRARDGKMRTTDVAPLWSCLLIVSLLQTPASLDLMKAIFKGIDGAVSRSVIEIKYRAQNIANGMEWAADEIHETMKQLDPPSIFGEGY